MKHMFFKSVMVAAAILLAWNCTDDTSSPSNNQALEFSVTENVWWIYTGTANYLIHPVNENGVYLVTDSWGAVVGSYGINEKNIYDISFNILVSNVDLNELAQITPNRTIVGTDGSITNMDTREIIVPGTSSASTTPVTPSAESSSNTAQVPVAESSSNNTQQAATSSSVASAEIKSSSSAKKEEVSSSSKKEDGGKIGDITYKGSLEQDVANEGTIQEIVFSNVQSDPTGSRTWKLYFLDMKYDSGAKTLTVTGTVSSDQKDRTLSETIKADGNDITITLNIGSAAKGNTPSDNKDKKSSSSTKPEAKSSSSQQLQQSVELKYINGGASGEGWATRYWDCCKPSCAWNENAGGHPTKTCTLQGNTVGPGDQSVCSGGQAAVCTSQIPVAVNDNLAYAFAAVPAANGGQCGKCFALEFTGEGKYETKAPHQALKGKILVVQVSNIGGDVNQGQFDVMIPGGGVGAFNGCSSIWGNNLGAQYGGLLSECEESVGYNGDLLKKRRDCLTEKCNSVFANHKDAKEGCLFLANWMQAAGNPKHKYREVECPPDLKAKW